MTNNEQSPAFGVWQPIETAPKDGSQVLIANDSGDIDLSSYISDWSETKVFVRKAKDGDVYRTIKEDNGYWDTDFLCWPTHWMPLPPPPVIE